MPALVVGLGNPGAAYAATRHNAGFWFADALAARHSAVFSASAKFNSECADIVSGDGAPVGRVRLIKPQTFMNLSGLAVAAAANYYRIAAADILVAYDEADLAPGVARLKFGGSSAGHNGIADIIKSLGDKNFWRLRIGIGRPAAGERGGDISDYVLRAPDAGQRDEIGGAIERAMAVWRSIVADDYNAAMTALHTGAAAVADS